MKKVLIIMPSMFIGGAERSLLGLLENLDYRELSVDLFLYRHEGELLKYIPKQINVLPEVCDYRTFDTPIKSLLFSRQFRFGLARIASKIALHLHCLITGEKSGVWMSMQYTARFLQPFLPNIEGSYDIGIMYLGIADTLINKVQTKMKFTWNHTDYDTLFPDRHMDLQTYAKVDWLVSVSETCTKKVIKRYPQIGTKAITIENTLSKNLIKSQATDPIDDPRWRDSDEYKLLSIGRFSDAKNFDNIPNICHKLLEKGVPVRWYIIGYGGEEQLIQQKIKEEGMQDNVIILGKKENPYPYIKACDLYVQPSRYEGKCVAVREAQMLGKPVVITRYATSSSQLEDNVDGVIVPMDNEGCAEGIAALFHDPEKMARLSENCRQRDYSNASEVKKLENIWGVD
ncbi:MAG: glycosyltransferase [Chordicoccus sp.]